MSARYDRGGCGTSMYQWLHPPWTTMSRSGASDVLVVSCEVTSKSRMIGLAPCQSWPKAASARWTDCSDSSQKACSQYGSGAVTTIRCLTWLPLAGFDDRSLSGGMPGSGGGAGGASLATNSGLAGDLAAAVAGL